MTAIPRDQAILDYLADHLRGITTAAGYRTNLGLDVLTDEPEFQPESPETGGLRTWLVDEQVTRKAEFADTLTLLIRGRVHADLELSPFPRALARQWVADIRQRMAALDAFAAGYPTGLDTVRFQTAEIPERAPQSNWLFPQVIYQIDIANRGAL